MSVGELLSMYRDDELDLHPEFQRFFRWNIEQKSKFIESLLLGIPVPPIFVSEQPNSRWDVIDGLQRLSTIFEVMGELKDETNGIKDQITLTRTRYLPSLEGKQWESEDKEKILPESAKIKIKRSRLDINIVKNTSDEIAKYEIFQRLNTGGSIATDQEVRNCVLIMNNRDLFEWIQDLSSEEDFRNCILLTERAEEEAFDLELLTRFIVFSTSSEESLSRIEELGDFLTNAMIRIAGDANFDSSGIKLVFEKTFNYLSTYLGQNSFRKFNLSKNCYYGGTLASLFEVVAVGIGRELLAGNDLPKANIFLEKHQLLGNNEQLRQFTKSGVRSSTRIPRTIAFGKELFHQCL
ncbi:DUF262 domain-containing protein [Nodosilinea sp. LEGE 07298]|nr:DUF262 domain-containing protein [Nodosilinea sp. LEGE 07298]